MPEGTKDSSLLIATSWQALNRAISDNQETLICDCTIVVLFAGFFLESNLNYIIEKMKLESEMKDFLKKKYPGMQDKLYWYYNSFVARAKAKNREQLFSMNIKRKIRKKFPGFANLYRFRNDLSHGVINQSAISLTESLLLRNQAKEIVNELFRIASKNGYSVPRDVSYFEAINSL
ncbi:MAG: hypothetical protein ABFS03_09630 [Chloroflexota bacterium]